MNTHNYRIAMRYALIAIAATCAALAARRAWAGEGVMEVNSRQMVTLLDLGRPNDVQHNFLIPISFEAWSYSAHGTELVNETNKAMGVWSNLPGCRLKFALDRVKVDNSGSDYVIHVARENVTFNDHYGEGIAHLTVVTQGGWRTPGTYISAFDVRLDPKVFKSKDARDRNATSAAAALAHHIGHGVGFNHSPAAKSGIMSRYHNEELKVNEGNHVSAILSVDDLATAVKLYPSAQALAYYKTVRGRVFYRGRPLHGIHVELRPTSTLRQGDLPGAITALTGYSSWRLLSRTKERKSFNYGRVNYSVVTKINYTGVYDDSTFEFSGVDPNKAYALYIWHPRLTKGYAPIEYADYDKEDYLTYSRTPAKLDEPDFPEKTTRMFKAGFFNQGGAVIELGDIQADGREGVPYEGRAVQSVNVSSGQSPSIMVTPAFQDPGTWHFIEIFDPEKNETVQVSEEGIWAYYGGGSYRPNLAPKKYDVIVHQVKAKSWKSGYGFGVYFWFDWSTWQWRYTWVFGGYCHLLLDESNIEWSSEWCHGALEVK